jgi:hypothetical protein
MHQKTRVELQQVTDRPLSSPRFDDEATLLTARPVVPLAEVSMSTSQSRFRWHRGATALASLVLVVAAGLILFRYNGSPEPQINSQPEVQAQASSLITDKTVVSPDASASGDPESNSQIPVKRSAMKETRAAAENHEKPQPARSPIVAVPREDEISDSYEPEQEDWQIRRRLSREERRLERRARREAWLRRDEDPDGLFRINDIFEGRRRP